MKRVLYRKKQSLENRRKMISINEFSDDQECRTHIRKSFIYIVTRVSDFQDEEVSPEITIVKNSDSKKSEEKFAFRVKGMFYMSKNRQKFKVDFCHSLQIEIQWKQEVISPNKSVTLT